MTPRPRLQASVAALALAAAFVLAALFGASGPRETLHAQESAPEPPEAQADDAAPPQRAERTSYILDYGERPPLVDPASEFARRPAFAEGLKLRFELAPPRVFEGQDFDAFEEGWLKAPDTLELHVPEAWRKRGLPSQLRGSMRYDDDSGQWEADIPGIYPFHDLAEALDLARTATWYMSDGDLLAPVKLHGDFLQPGLIYGGRYSVSPGKELLKLQLPRQTLQLHHFCNDQTPLMLIHVAGVIGCSELAPGVAADLWRGVELTAIWRGSWRDPDVRLLHWELPDAGQRPPSLNRRGYLAFKPNFPCTASDGVDLYLGLKNARVSYSFRAPSPQNGRVECGALRLPADALVQPDEVLLAFQPTLPESSWQQLPLRARHGLLQDIWAPWTIGGADVGADYAYALGLEPDNWRYRYTVVTPEHATSDVFPALTHLVAIDRSSLSTDNEQELLWFHNLISEVKSMALPLDEGQAMIKLGAIGMPRNPLGVVGRILVSGNLLPPADRWPETMFEQGEQRAFALPCVLRSSAFRLEGPEEDDNTDPFFSYKKPARICAFQTFGRDDISLATNGEFGQVLWAVGDESQIDESQLPNFASLQEALANAHKLSWRIVALEHIWRESWTASLEAFRDTSIPLPTPHWDGVSLRFDPVQMPGGFVDLSCEYTPPAMLIDGSVSSEDWSTWGFQREPKSMEGMNLDVSFNYVHGSAQAIASFPWHPGAQRVYLPSGTCNVSAHAENYEFWGQENWPAMNVPSNASTAVQLTAAPIVVDVLEGAVTTAVLPFTRHLHRIHVTSPDGDPGMVSLYVLPYGSGRGDCSANQMYSYQSRATAQLAMEIKRGLLVGESVLRDYAAEIYDWQLDNIDFYLSTFEGTSPFYISNRTGPAPLLMLATTATRASELVWVAMDQQDITIDLKHERSRSGQPYRRDLDSWGHRFDQRTRVYESLQLQTPRYPDADKAPENGSSIWLCIRRPDGAVMKKSMVFERNRDDARREAKELDERARAEQQAHNDRERRRGMAKGEEEDIWPSGDDPPDFFGYSEDSGYRHPLPDYWEEGYPIRLEVDCWGTWELWYEHDPFDDSERASESTVFDFTPATQARTWQAARASIAGPLDRMELPLPPAAAFHAQESQDCPARMQVTLRAEKRWKWGDELSVEGDEITLQALGFVRDDGSHLIWRVDSFCTLDGGTRLRDQESMTLWGSEGAVQAEFNRGRITLDRPKDWHLQLPWDEEQADLEIVHRIWSPEFPMQISVQQKPGERLPFWKVSGQFFGDNGLQQWGKYFVRMRTPVEPPLPDMVFLEYLPDRDAVDTSKVTFAADVDFNSWLQSDDAPDTEDGDLEDSWVAQSFEIRRVGGGEWNDGFSMSRGDFQSNTLASVELELPVGNYELWSAYEGSTKLTEFSVLLKQSSMVRVPFVRIWPTRIQFSGWNDYLTRYAESDDEEDNEWALHYSVKLARGERLGEVIGNPLLAPLIGEAEEYSLHERDQVLSIDDVNAGPHTLLLYWKNIPLQAWPITVDPCASTIHTIPFPDIGYQVCEFSHPAYPQDDGEDSVQWHIVRGSLVSPLRGEGVETCDFDEGVHTAILPRGDYQLIESLAARYASATMQRIPFSVGDEPVRMNVSSSVPVDIHERQSLAQRKLAKNALVPLPEAARALPVVASVWAYLPAQLGSGEPGNTSALPGLTFLEDEDWRIPTTRQGENILLRIPDDLPDSAMAMVMLWNIAPKNPDLGVDAWYMKPASLGDLRSGTVQTWGELVSVRTRGYYSSDAADTSANFELADGTLVPTSPFLESDRRNAEWGNDWYQNIPAGPMIPRDVRAVHFVSPDGRYTEAVPIAIEPGTLVAAWPNEVQEAFARNGLH